MELQPVAACPACGEAARSGFMTSPAQMHDGVSEHFDWSTCETCGLVYLDPRVPQTSLRVFYGPGYLPYRGADAWGRWAPLVRLAERVTDRRRCRVLRRHTSLSSRSCVLDVGCGRPTFLARLRRTTGCRAHGIDFQDLGWRSDPERWLGLTLLHGTLAETLAQLPHRIDAITMWHFLEHDYAPHDTLRRLLDLAHPGTRLVVEVPDHDSWTRRVHGERWAGYHTPRHTAAYEEHTLTRLLERSGWELVAALPYGSIDPYLVWWLGRRERSGLDWTASMEGHFPSFLAGKILTSPFFALSRWIRMGAMIAVARPR